MHGKRRSRTDPDLQLIIERWNDLCDPLKAGIPAMIRTADPPAGRNAG